MKNLFCILLLSSLAACAKNSDSKGSASPSPVAQPTSQPTSPQNPATPASPLTAPPASQAATEPDIDSPEPQVESRECVTEDLAATRTSMDRIKSELDQVERHVDQAMSSSTNADKKRSLQEAYAVAVKGVRQCRVEVKTVKIETCRIAEAVVGHAVLLETCSKYERTAYKLKFVIGGL